MKFTTRLYIENFECDLTDRFEGAMQYSLDNIKDISSISSNYSNTITLPGTAKNCQLFNYLYNPKNVGTVVSGSANIGSNYDFKKKAKAALFQDGQIILDGYAKLISATVNNGQASFDIQISSPISSLFSNLGELRLQDLYPASGGTKYDHDLTLENITNSWKISSSDACEASTRPYLYPLQDSGQFETTNGMNHYTQNLRPCLYLKQYLDKCFETASFTYDSPFISSSYFQSLVLPYKDGDIKFPQANYVQTDASGLGYYQTQSIIPRGYQDSNLYLFSGINQGSYLVGGAFFPVVSSVYSFDVSFRFQLFFDALIPYIEKLNTDILGYVRFASYKTADDSFVTDTYSQFKFPKNTVDFYDLSATSSMQSIGVSNTLRVNNDEYAKVSVTFGSVYDNTLFFGSPDDTFSPGSGSAHIYSDANTSLSINSSGVVDGNAITYQQLVLKDVKCTDLIKSTLRLFNLYPVSDKDIKNHLHIKTYDEFYSNTSSLDWTKKLNKAEDFKVTPIPQVDSGFLKFSYQPDKDYWNTYVSNISNGGTYGQLRVNLGYEFAQTEKDVLDGLIFSPTVPVQYQNTQFPCETNIEVSGNRVSVSGYSASLAGIGANTGSLSSNGFTKSRKGVQISYYGATYTITNCINQQSFEVDRVLIPSTTLGTFKYLTNSNPTLIPIYQSKDNNLTRSTQAVNPRILFYNGLRQATNAIYVQYTPNLTSVSYSYFTGDGSSQYWYSSSYYPHCSHLNDDTAPSKDLLFLEPEQVLFDIDQYPTSSLFDFWENSVNEIADPEAKMIEAKIKLNALDISNLDFSNRLYIDGTTYRLSEITDYTSNPNETTQVTLVRMPYQVYHNLTGSPVPPPSPSSSSFFVSGSMSNNTGTTMNAVYVAGQPVTFTGTGSNFPLSGIQKGKFSGSIPTLGVNDVRVYISSSRAYMDYLKFTDAASVTQSLIEFSGSGYVDSKRVLFSGSTLYVTISGSNGGAGTFSTLWVRNSASSTANVSAVYVNAPPATIDAGSLPVYSGSLTTFTVITGSVTYAMYVEVTGSAHKFLTLSGSGNPVVSASVSSSAYYYFMGVNTDHDTYVTLRNNTGSAPPPTGSGGSGSIVTVNYSPNAVIHTVGGVTGYHLPASLHNTEFYSGSFSTFTGSVSVNITVAPTETGFLNYDVGGINKSSIPVAIGFTGTKIFTYSGSVGASQSIYIHMEGLS